ncbi:MAG: ATP-binding protein [Phycisphaerae bacterium]
MSVIPDAASTDLVFCQIGASSCLPGELLAEILERIPLPIVVDRPTDGVFLNTTARSLWLTTGDDSADLPVMVDAKVHSLLTLPSVAANGAGPTVTPHVRVPGGEQYEANMFRWKRAADSPAWRVVILRPPGDGPAEGGLLADKVNRLKAIVHEFRNTLTAAREALALMHEGAVGELNAGQRRLLDSAREDLEGLGRAMVDLTALWVTQAGVLRMMPRPVDIRRVVEQTTLCAQPVAEKQGISLHVEIGDPSPILTGDHELLVQALRNVVTNALRHTSTGGEIRIRAFVMDAARRGAPDTGYIPETEHSDPSTAEGADESVIIEVYDSGTGIGAADQERVFQAFERGSAEELSLGPPGSGGMGLGLTIARDIAWRHGGTLQVRSAPGNGSCFVFRFPKSETCAQSWMVRVTQQAIEDVRPLGAPLASVLLRFETDSGNPGEGVHPDLLSALQQVAIQNLRPTDTVLAIEGQLLLLIRGSTRPAAYAMIDRVLHSLAEMFRTGRATFGAYHMVFGVAAYPEDGSSPEAILARAAAELSAFSIGAGPGTEERHEQEADDPAG